MSNKVFIVKVPSFFEHALYVLGFKRLRKSGVMPTLPHMMAWRTK